MAFQNFEQGGFIGRLGEVVGYRLRGKYCLRVLSDQNNASKEGRIPMRRNFAAANKLAQFARRVNCNLGGFPTTAMTEYNARVKQVADGISAGLPKETLFPLLYDTIFIPETAVFSGWNIPAGATNVQVVMAVPAPPTAGYYLAIATVFDGEGFPLYFDMAQVTPAGNNFLVDIPLSDLLHSSNRVGVCVAGFSDGTLSAPVTQYEQDFSIV